MDFIDKLMDTFSSTGKDISEKAKTIVAAGKLQSQISAEQNKIREAYRTIGKCYADAHRDNADDPYADLIAQIAASERAIDQLQRQAELLKGLQRCPNCGGTVEVSAKFCPRCGARLPESAAVDGAEDMETLVQAYESVSSEDTQDKTDDPKNE